MRSVVVVLPASMCAMIPMLRVFSSVNLRGMAQLGGIVAVGAGMVVWCLGPALSGLELRLAVFEQKNGPLGPTRAAGLTGPVRVVYLLEVSILVGSLRGMLARLLRPRSEGRL